MNVVGLDLAYGSPKTHTGTGVATTNGTRSISTSASGMERLAWMRDQLVVACHEGGPPTGHECGCFLVAFGVHPDLVAIEGPSYASPNNASMLGMLRGVVLLEFFELRIPTIEVPPSNVKQYATGKGNASKDDVLLAAVRQLGYEGNSKDQADAMWVRAVTLAALDEPIVTVPQTHLKALVPIRKALALVLAPPN